MADVFSKEKRSKVMRSIKSKGTKLETDTAQDVAPGQDPLPIPPKGLRFPGLYRRRQVAALLRRLVLAWKALEQVKSQVESK